MPPSDGSAAPSCDTQLLFIRQIPPEFTTADLRTFFHHEVNRHDATADHSADASADASPQGSGTPSPGAASSFQTHDTVDTGHTAPTGASTASCQRRRPPFVRFHFKHRTDLESSSDGGTPCAPCLCGIVEVHTDQVDRFVAEYNGERWFDAAGKESPHTVAITLAPSALRATLEQFPELQPPAVLPQGNVGTCDSDLHLAIRECRLPASLIRTLRLNRPFISRLSKPHYRHMPFVYPGQRVDGAAASATWQELRQLRHDLCYRAVTAEAIATRRRAEAAAHAAAMAKGIDSDEEEWDRAARYADEDDADGDQGRAKERVYEGDVSQPWEKGGSGLVFHTDAARWDAAEGDVDEKWADEWDVDTQAHDRAGGFVADETHIVTELRDKGLLYWMHRGRHHEPGKTVTPDDAAFRAPAPPPSPHSSSGAADATCPDQAAHCILTRETERGSDTLDRPNAGPRLSTAKRREPAAKRQSGTPIGAFEAHTRGVGSKIMRAHGWSEGESLGGVGKQSALTVPVGADTTRRVRWQRFGVGMTAAAASAKGKCAALAPKHPE
eukprot:m.215383 g.215383  ORF g.215383 m.215383 type:complete len:555 (-) comp25615_c0_seq2:1598-3262(-)